MWVLLAAPHVDQLEDLGGILRPGQPRLRRRRRQGQGRCWWRRRGRGQACWGMEGAEETAPEAGGCMLKPAAPLPCYCRQVE